MKLLAYFATALFLSAGYAAPTFENIKSLQADAEMMASVLKNGGVTPKGTPCTFEIGIQKMYGKDFLTMTGKSDFWNKPGMWGFALTDNDDDIHVKETILADGTKERMYGAYDELSGPPHYEDSMKVSVPADGTHQMIVLYMDDDHTYQCVAP